MTDSEVVSRPRPQSPLLAMPMGGVGLWMGLVRTPLLKMWRIPRGWDPDPVCRFILVSRNALLLLLSVSGNKFLLIT